MPQYITIQNDELMVVISTLGAEIQSIKKDTQEKLWAGNEKIWAGHAPILFPICGGLKDGKYTFEGREYALKQHGYASKSEFVLESFQKNSATFLLCSDEETLKVYPFDYELRITYTIDGSVLTAKSEVKNIGKGDMYYAIGAHEGYAISGGIENYSVVFEHTEDIKRRVVKGVLLSGELEDLALNTNELKLNDEYFEVEAIVFSDLKSRALTLRDDRIGESIKVKFDGFDYLLIWKLPEAEYVCIEPWCCIPDSIDADGDITRKPGMINLKSGELSEKVHSIEF